MPSYGHRALLRLRRVPMAKRVRPTVMAHSFATAAETPVRPDMGLPSFMLRSGNLGAYALGPYGASPVASSSKITLDAFLDAEQDNSLWSALNFARDDELLRAALASPGERSSDWLDPASAYIGLRNSGMFSHYLQVLIPRIRTLYANLRPSGLHQVLVSDLLLRNPDPMALREILLEEVDPSHRHSAGDRLRSGLVAQAYRGVAPHIRRRTMPRLTRPAYLIISNALRKHEGADLLPDVFYELAHDTNWEPDSTWHLLEIALHLARKGQATGALRLLQYPIALGKLPQDALGRSAAGHPEAATLMVQATIARTALSWGLDKRATYAINDLVHTMQRTVPSAPALELVYQAIRYADVSRVHVGWASEILLRLASDHRFPPLVSAAIDVHLDALPTPAALEFYTSLTALPDAERHAPAGPRHLHRIALANPTRVVLRRIATELARHPRDVSAAIPGILRSLAGARLLTITRAAYTAWRGAHRTQPVDTPTALSIVRAFTRGARTAANTGFARTVLADCLATSQATPSDVALSALHAHILLNNKGDAHDGEAAAIAALVAAHGQVGAIQRVLSLMQKDPLIAHRVLQVLREHSLASPNMGIALAASCAAGHWGALAAASARPGTPDAAYLSVLKYVRKGRMTAATKALRAAVDTFPDAPVRVPTIVAVLGRAPVKEAWTQGLEVAAIALKAGGEEIIDASALFLSAFARAAQGGVLVTEAWAEWREVIVGGVEGLGPAQNTLLSTVVERVDAGVAAVRPKGVEAVEAVKAVRAVEAVEAVEAAAAVAL